MNGSATIFPRGSFALKLRKLPRATIDARVQEAADLLSIGDLLTRKPKQLSGGQRQRVALGRAIVRHPQVFLFDEPLSNLQGGSVSFRRDVESFLDADAIRAVPVPDRRELPPVAGVRSVAFVDPSGGSQDAFTLAIAHGDGGGRCSMLCVRSGRPSD